MISITDPKIAELRKHFIELGFHNTNNGAFEYSLIVKDIGKSDLKLYVSLSDFILTAVYADKKYNANNRYGEKEKRVEYKINKDSQINELIHNIDKFIDSVAKENFS